MASLISRESSFGKFGAMENKSLFENTAVAATVLGGVYILVGRLGTLLALPPGYATAVFPASGIALTGVLCLGYRVWPGILCGSFFMNLWISIEAAQSFSLARFLPAGIGIGLGREKRSPGRICIDGWPKAKIP